MKVIDNYEGLYPEDPIRYFNFQKFEKISKDCYLFLGENLPKKAIGLTKTEFLEIWEKHSAKKINGGNDVNNSWKLYNTLGEDEKKIMIKEKCNDIIYNSKYRDKERIFFTTEEPNSYHGGDILHMNLSKEVDKILTLCPYTAELDDKRIPVFFPFNVDYIPKNFEKIYDVFYIGHGPRFYGWSKIMKVASKFNFLTVSYKHGKFAGCNYQTKLDLYARSKISLIQNLIGSKRQNIHYYKLVPNFDKNKAFKFLDDGYRWYNNIQISQSNNNFLKRISNFINNWSLKINNIKWRRLKWMNMMPQIKARVFEAAFCKSLMLVLKDPWNIIEKFFKPNKEFLYFNDLKDLYKKLDLILNNYDDYQHIIDAAYNRAINNYTTKHFIEKYIGFL